MDLTIRMLLFINITELELYRLLAGLILGKKYTLGINHLLIATGIAALLTMAKIPNGDNGSTLLIGILLNILYLYMIYRKKPIDTLYLTLIALTVIRTIQVIIGIAFFFLTGFLNMPFYLNVKLILFVKSTSIFLILFINKKISLHHLFHFITERNTAFTQIIFCAFIISVFITLLLYGDVAYLIHNLPYILFITGILILVNWFLLKKGLENQVTAQKLKLYDDYIPIIEKLIQKIRENQHDFDNHFLALKTLINSSEPEENIIEKAREYLNDLEQVNSFAQFIKMDNKLLGGFLYSKLKLAETRGIIFNVDVRDYYFKVGLKDYELIEVIGILIDNAFETEVLENEVKVSFYQEKEQSIIEVRNKHPYLTNQQIITMFKKGYSTKKKHSRGIGLYKLTQIVEKYGGTLEVLNEKSEDNYVVIKLYLLRV